MCAKQVKIPDSGKRVFLLFSASKDHWVKIQEMCSMILLILWYL
jgi:hypothetical protein